MNLRYLGDALDHWKGSLFSILAERELLNDLAVDPMATDQSAWRAEDFELYAMLLRIASTRVLRHQRTLAARSAYFAEIRHSGDIFLDPDTGIATGAVKAKVQYVEPADVCRLLFSGMNRAVVVYQHVRAQRTCDRVDAVVRVFPSEIRWCSYESGSVAMMFFSMAPWRVEELTGWLNEFLGRHAAGRIRSGVT